MELEPSARSFNRRPAEDIRFKLRASEDLSTMSDAEPLRQLQGEMIDVEPIAESSVSESPAGRLGARSCGEIQAEPEQEGAF